MTILLKTETDDRIEQKGNLHKWPQLNTSLKLTNIIFIYEWLIEQLQYNVVQN